MNELEVLRGLVSSSEGPLGVIGILLSIALVLFMLRRPVKPPSGEGANKASPSRSISSEVDMDEVARATAVMQQPLVGIVQQLLHKLEDNTGAITTMASNVEKVVMAVLNGDERTQGLIRSEGLDTRHHFDETITPLVKAIHDLTDEIRAMRADLNPPPPQAPKVIALPVIEEAPKKRGRRKKTPPDDVVQEKVA